MKTRLLFLPAAALVLAVSPLHAIPSTITGQAFVNVQGNDEHQPVEEWFRLPYHWQAGSVLPGIWATANGDPSHLAMEHPGSVFGIAARSITVVKDKAGAISEVITSFVEADAKKSRSALIAALEKNIGVFAGSAAKKLADGSMTFSTSGMNIILATAGGITVKFTRA